MTDLIIDITRRDEAWPDLTDQIGTAVQYVLDEIDSHRRGELSVVLSDDEHVQMLNRDYRGKDKPTNVLSFPMPEETGLMGDVVLSRQTLIREAGEQGKSFMDHFTHLLIHGVLHLHGYDHMTETDAAEMEMREIAALKRLGIDNPYEASKR